MVMNVRDLDSHVKALSKALNANEPTPVILAILETLKKDGTPTEEMLRTTKAGVFVGKLRANTNKEISRSASELVGKWRKAVEAEKKGRRPPTGTASPGATATTTLNPAPKSTPPAAASSRGQPFKGDIEKRKHESDGIDIKKTGSMTRNSCIGLLYNGLAYRSRENEHAVLEKAVAVETAAFDHFGGETKAYKDKIRSLFQNLKAKSNRELGPKVMTGAVTAKDLVTLTSDELKSSEQKKTDDDLMKENIRNAQIAKAAKSMSAELKCGNCNERKVSYTQAQTRSADEPMTTFCECLNCGKRWKFS